MGLLTVENSRLAEQMILSITSSPTEANKQQIYARPTDTMHHHRWSNINHVPTYFKPCHTPYSYNAGGQPLHFLRHMSIIMRCATE